MVDLLVRQDSATGDGIAPLAVPETPGFEWPWTTRRFQTALRGHPYRQDLLLATIVFLLTLLPTQAGQPSELLHAGPLLVVASVVQSVALIWRRPAPLVTFAVVLATCTVEWASAVSSSSDIGLLICLYGVARYRSLMMLRVALGAIVPSLIVLLVRTAPIQRPTLVSRVLPRHGGRRERRVRPGGAGSGRRSWRRWPSAPTTPSSSASSEPGWPCWPSGPGSPARRTTSSGTAWR